MTEVRSTSDLTWTPQTSCLCMCVCCGRGERERSLLGFCEGSQPLDGLLALPPSLQHIGQLRAHTGHHTHHVTSGTSSSQASIKDADTQADAYAPNILSKRILLYPSSLPLSHTHIHTYIHTYIHTHAHTTHLYLYAAVLIQKAMWLQSILLTQPLADVCRHTCKHAYKAPHVSHRCMDPLCIDSHLDREHRLHNKQSHETVSPHNMNNTHTPPLTRTR